MDGLLRWGHDRERGSSIVDFTFLGTLFLLPLIWFMLGVFEVQRGYFGVVAASREASRAYVLGADQGEGQARAQQAAELALQDQGIHPGEADIEGPVCREGNNVGPSYCHQAGSSAEYTVSYGVSVPFVERLFDYADAHIEVENTHITPYGEYRQSR